MATTDEIRAVIDQYVARFNAGDGAGWAALFAEDATQEDPVGTPANVGREAIQGFYDNMSAMLGGGLRIVPKHDPIIIGNEATFAASAYAGTGENRACMPDIVDLMTFAEDGSITSLRAYWTMDSMVPDPE
jgi:steroid delta-isomerase